MAAKTQKKTVPNMKDEIITEEPKAPETAAETPAAQAEQAELPPIQSLFEMRFRTDYAGEVVGVRQSAIGGLLEIYQIVE